MKEERYYPVQRLCSNVMNLFSKIESSDIIGNIRSGLENEIELIDIEEHV